MKLGVTSALVALLLLVAPGRVAATSDESWVAFRADVLKTCTALAKKWYAEPIVLVDPYGSSSYGIALVYARLPSPKGATPAPGLATVVCIYDKKTKKAELSGEFRTVNP